jgi:regulator of sigma D
MLNEIHPQIERRAQSHNLIRDLINTRTEMLALYSKLAAKKPFNNDDSVPELLQEFCQILVDYTASAHFRLYRFIEEKMEKRKRVLDAAESMYPRIIASTRFIVDFNDKYESNDEGGIPETLESDLSQLGELMAERIELEDSLIEILSTTRQENTEEAVQH